MYQIIATIGRKQVTITTPNREAAFWYASRTRRTIGHGTVRVWSCAAQMFIG
jgi:hypothetical protein